MTEQTSPIATKIGLLLHRLIADDPDSKLPDFDRNLLDDLLVEVAGTPEGVGIGKAMKLLRVHAELLRADVVATSAVGRLGISEYQLAMMERGAAPWTKQAVVAVIGVIRS